MKHHTGLILAVALLSACAQGSHHDSKIRGNWKSSRKPLRLRIVSWNVQNLFDAEWQGTEYPEYDPRPRPKSPTEPTSSGGSQQTWGQEGFRYRLKSLASVLDRLDADILVLTEIESELALRQLNLQLRKPFSYRLLLPQSDQAVNIGLLSQIKIRRSLRHEIGYAPDSATDSLTSQRQLRAIVEVQLENGLVLFLNHWKSQREGFFKTLPQRQQAAALLAELLIRRQGTQLLDSTSSCVLALGDFNEPVDSYFRQHGGQSQHLSSFQLLRQVQKPEQGMVLSLTAQPLLPSKLNEANPKVIWQQAIFSSPWFAYGELIQAMAESDRPNKTYSAELAAPVLWWADWQQLAAKGLVAQKLSPELGSYYFRGEWQAIDNILLSAGCFPARDTGSVGAEGVPARKNWQFANFAVPHFAPLLKANSHGDLQPNAWRRESISGISDHLPLLLELEQDTTTVNR